LHSASRLRLPRTLAVTVLAGALGCGAATTTRDAAAGADAAVADAAPAPLDLAPATGDACALIVYCAPAVTGASCGGAYCDITECPPGCEPFT